MFEEIADDRIGAWVSRQRGEKPLTKAHLCESIVNDGPFTRCGRLLKARKNTFFMYVDTTDHPCVTCS